MSYITFQVQCKDCGKEMNAAFGVVGTTVIDHTVSKCPDCGSEKIEKIADGWNLPKFAPQ